MNTRSLRFRLTAWHAVVLTLVFVVLGVLLFVQLRHYLENTLLDAQTRRAEQIGQTLVAGLPGSGQASLAGSAENLYSPEHSDRFIRITRKDGVVLYTSGVPTDLSFDPTSVQPLAEWPAHLSTRKAPGAGGDPLLIAATRAVSQDGKLYLVEVGTSSAPVDALLRRLAILLGFGLPVVVLVAAGGGYVLVQRALRPVEEIAGKAESITQHNLSERLPVARTGDELERLSLSLNLMINRLDDAFMNSKRFVADASHELRTPMTIVRGELESLIQQEGLAEGFTDRLGNLLEEVERLSKIVERLFALSRLDAGESQAEWISFDLWEMAATTASHMALLAEDKKITLTCPAADMVPVKGDRARMKQVIVNLLDNAIRYTLPGGAIQIDVFAARGKAVLEVSDTGIGIEGGSLPHIFERFYRSDEARLQEPEGAGLGLAIVKSICSAHGGEVTAESSPGRGSRFHVELPLSSRPTSSLTSL